MLYVGRACVVDDSEHAPLIRRVCHERSLEMVNLALHNPASWQVRITCLRTVVQPQVVAAFLYVFITCVISRRSCPGQHPCHTLYLFTVLIYWFIGVFIIWFWIISILWSLHATLNKMLSHIFKNNRLNYRFRWEKFIVCHTNICTYVTLVFR